MIQLVIKNFFTITVIFLLAIQGLNAQYLIKKKSVRGKKTTIKTEFAPGYITDMSGTVQEGEIQLKIINSDTAFITLKSMSGKETYKRYDIQYFGLRLTESYFKTFKDYRKNFHKGYYINNSGEKKEGRVALRYNEDITGKQGDKHYKDNWKVYLLLFEGSDSYVNEVRPENVKEIGQVGPDGKMVRFEKVQTVWTEILDKGALYTMLHNPFPEVVDNKKTSKANFWKSILGRRIAINMAGSDVRMTSHTGGSGILVVYGYEYILRPTNGGDTLTVNDEKHIHFIERILLEQCPQYNDLGKREKRKFVKWENFEKLMRWANDNCAIKENE